MKDVVVSAIMRSQVPPDPQHPWIYIPPGQSRTRTNADGWFTLHLPAGLYWLSADPCSLANDNACLSDGGLSYDLSDARLLEVTAGDEPQRFDFSLGAVEVALQVPPTLKGQFSWRADFNGKPGSPRFSAIQTAPTTESWIRVEGIVPGAYAVRLMIFPHTQPGESILWVGGTADYSDADSIVILPDQTAELAVSLPEPGTLRGRVYGNLEPARSQYLWAEAQLEHVPPRDISGHQASSRVDSLGEYCIFFLVPCRVRLAMSTWGGERWYGGTCFEDAAVFEVGPGKTVWADSIGVSNISYGLKGVRAPDSVRATIKVHDSAGRYVCRSGIYDAHRQPICNLPPGSYLLSILPDAAQGWKPQWYDRASRMEDATPVVISSEGETVDITITLERGGSIRGRVRGLGSARSRPQLLASAPGFSWRPCGFWAVDSGGCFVMDGLPDGEIKIGAGMWSHCVYLTWYPGTASADSARPIVIENAGEVTGIEWQLLPSR